MEDKDLSDDALLHEYRGDHHDLKRVHDAGAALRNRLAERRELIKLAEAVDAYIMPADGNNELKKKYQAVCEKFLAWRTFAGVK